MFTGKLHIKVCEANGLRPTDFQKRHNMTFGKPDDQPIDPYVSIDVDENHLGKYRAIYPYFSPQDASQEPIEAQGPRFRLPSVQSFMPVAFHRENRTQHLLRGGSINLLCSQCQLAST